jgi:hypothetical protein
MEELVMKNIGLKVATIICGGLAVVNGLLSVLGLLCGIIDMCLFFAVPTLIFGIPAIKLAKKIGWIKPKVKVNKVKEEKVNVQESGTVEPMFAFNENESIEPTFETIEEKPVEEKVIDINEFRKEEPKEEKNEDGKKYNFIERIIIKLTNKLEAFSEKTEKETEELRRKRIERENNMSEEEKAKEAASMRRWENAGELIGKILAYVLCGGLIIGAIVLVCYVGYILLAFIFNAALYIIGLGLFIWIASAFLRYWWFLVRWEHCKHPVRVKRRRRW